MDRYKSLYDSLLESGDLQDLFPSMKCIWEKDKTKFINKQKDLESYIGGIEYEESND